MKKRQRITAWKTRGTHRSLNVAATRLMVPHPDNTVISSFLPDHHTLSSHRITMTGRIVPEDDRPLTLVSCWKC